MASSDRRRNAGLTMIEVMVATFILTAIVAMASWMVWSSSKRVSTAEVNLQMDMQLREVVDKISRELRQSRLAQIKSVDSASITVNTVTLAATASPGTASAMPSNAGIPATGFNFYSIRFKIPGTSMDITQNNAGNFNLTNFVNDNDTNNPNWTTEIQYWWEPDAMQGEGVPGLWANNNAPDGVDNNKNGVIDEGVIKRMETTYDTSGLLVNRTVSVVCRDVQIAGPPTAPPATWVAGKAKIGLTFAVFPSAPAVPPALSQKPNQMMVTVTMERPDPENKGTTIVKQMSSTIFLRNN
jgi:Tfp pilus assembly protein PilE